MSGFDCAEWCLFVYLDLFDLWECCFVLLVIGFAFQFWLLLLICCLFGLYFVWIIILFWLVWLLVTYGLLFVWCVVFAVGWYVSCWMLIYCLLVFGFACICGLILTCWVDARIFDLMFADYELFGCLWFVLLVRLCAVICLLACCWFVFCVWSLGCYLIVLLVWFVSMLFDLLYFIVCCVWLFWLVCLVLVVCWLLFNCNFMV